MRQHPTGPLQETLLEVFNGGRADFAGRLVAPDYVEHALPPSPPAAPGGLPALIAYLEHMRRAFPDLRLNIEDAVAKHDRLALRLSATGTHLGPLRGMAPTRRGAEWGEMHFFRLKDGGLRSTGVSRAPPGCCASLGWCSLGVRHDAAGGRPKQRRNRSGGSGEKERHVLDARPRGRRAALRGGVPVQVDAGAGQVRKDVGLDKPECPWRARRGGGDGGYRESEHRNRPARHPPAKP